MGQEDDGRDETEQERLDRLWADQLQELRVMQTGIQLLAGFLLTLPFQSTFADLDSVQRGMFLALVVLAALTTLTLVTPVAIHRRLSGQQVKDRVVAAGQKALVVALGGVALLVVGMLTFIVDVVVGRTTGLAVGAGGAAVALTLLVVVPRSLDDDS